jgi:hypothetical protein
MIIRDPLCTLQEVAQELGVKIERARQIEITALRKLRQWCAENGWDAEDFFPRDDVEQLIRPGYVGRADDHIGLE